MLDFTNLKAVADTQKRRSYILAERFLQDIFNRIKFMPGDSVYPFIVDAEAGDFTSYEEYQKHIFGDSNDEFEFFYFAEYTYCMDFLGNLVFTIIPEEKHEQVLELLKDVLLHNGFTVTESGHTFKRNIFDT